MPFKSRSREKEYLDMDNIEAPELFRNLRELHSINKHLGGYAASQKALTSLLDSKKNIRNVLDIGFGGGDTIKQLSKVNQQEKAGLFFYGVDIKKECVDYAETNLAALQNKKLIWDDYRNISPELLKSIDVIHCSLFLHHLSNDEIVDLLKFARQHKCIVVANDLHRNWFAYYSIKMLTSVLSRSYLVKNDAPLSVKRGFTRSELTALVEKAGFKNYTLEWSWAFRFVLIAKE
jgi:2-polyprenyl-3-methyl-5-hydroxy-6-metoxy-1,4-benzoquinol methylase